MSINKKIIITVAAGLVLGVSSCRKFLDVNTNPNATPKATVQTLLTGSQLTLTSALGVDLQIDGSMWAGYWTQSPNSSQYKTIEQYAPGQDAFTYPWDNLYSANENFFQMAKQAESENKKQYVAVSLLMRAYTFQLIADGWGDAPFGQALKGAPEDGGIVNPKYDSQRVIYTGCLKYIDSAEKIMHNSGGITPTTDDIVYSGDMTKWEKFGYTLKLKMLLRLAYIDPVWAQSGIAALYADSNVSFIGNGDDAVVKFGYSSTNKNPLNAEMTSTTLAGTQNIVGSSTFIDTMWAYNDNRIYVFYKPLSNGNFAGIRQGAYDISASASTYSIPASYVGADASSSTSKDAPVNLITSYESYFLQAEVAARNWAVGASTDEDLFYQGILANFNYYNTAITNETGVTGTQSYHNYVDTTGGYWTVYPASGTTEQRIRHIITQKWFAMCGNQGFEAWTEFRRTGYPDFFIPSKNSLIGSQLPKRFLYPTSESTRNSAFPGIAALTLNTWWDKN